MRNRASLFYTGSLAMVLSAIVCVADAQAAFEIDPVHSSFIFRIQHLGVSYAYGRFNESSGSFFLDAADPSKNRVEIEVKTDSIDTANEARDKHLKSPEFFDTAQFPVMTFKSTSFKKKDDSHFEVAGDLTIRGITRPVTTTAELAGLGKGMKGETRAGLEAVFTIDRRDFGMDAMVGPIGAEVRITVSLEGIAK
ncbi:MAG: YceI family protein [Candidatus Hydrogenedentes bacterium]|nr:YceI family protein [Candidatus Hydrogenedentota bacterium]